MSAKAKRHPEWTAHRQVSGDSPSEHHRGYNGHHGRERVAEIQRARILGAVTETCVEHGAASVTVAHVVQRAGVSRRTFYELFSDIEDCLLAAFEEGLARGSALVRQAYGRKASWRERIREALLALLRFCEAEPLTGRLLIVETAGAGANALKRRQEVLARLVAAVDEGRSESKSPPPPLSGEGVVGAVLSIVHARMLEDDVGSLVELLNPLMSIAMLPYRGVAASRRELECQTPEPVRRPPVAGGNTLKTLDLRLTYRTVCVLTAVADNPGSSNRIVGSVAGIHDQGQISKLLARLHKLGLVENVRSGSLRGEPNRWTLTPAGREVHASVAYASP
jgi:AcrR family transcriptional regulator